MVRRWWRGARTAVAQLETLLLPRVCLSCEQLLAPGNEAMVCAACWQRLSLLPHPRCARCGHPGSGESCRWCPLLPPYVRAVRSCCWVPGGVGERVVHAFKYEGWHRVGVELAARMARLDWPDDVVRERTALVPVPLAGDRLRARGFNQSAVLAEALAPLLQLPAWPRALERVRQTVTQTRLTPEQRLHNVAHAFRVAPDISSRLPGAHVVLVDDVVTTAATLNACAATLWGAGARIISYVTFGRARAAGDAPLPRG